MNVDHDQKPILSDEEPNTTSWELPDSLNFANYNSDGSLIPDHELVQAQSIAKGTKKSNKNMDPFEVRLRFTQLLQNLNASVTSANKTAQYALRYKDMDEDLHSCIIEQLERVSIL